MKIGVSQHIAFEASGAPLDGVGKDGRHRSIYGLCTLTKPGSIERSIARAGKGMARPGIAWGVMSVPIGVVAAPSLLLEEPSEFVSR